MAADINKVVLVGRLTRDAEQSYTQSGYAILKFSIAVNRRRKQGDQWIDEGNFFDVTVWGKQGEAIASFMTKGKQVAVEGDLRQDRWQDKNDGSNRSKVVIEANNIQLLGSRDGGSQGGSYQNNGGNQQQGGGNFGGGNTNANTGGWNGGNTNAPPVPSANPQPQGPPPTSFEDDIPF